MPRYKTTKREREVKREIKDLLSDIAAGQKGTALLQTRKHLTSLRNQLSRLEKTREIDETTCPIEKLDLMAALATWEGSYVAAANLTTQAESLREARSNLSGQDDLEELSADELLQLISAALESLPLTSLTRIQAQISSLMAPEESSGVK